MFRGAASVTARERMRRRATTLALVASIWASARGARAVPAVCTEARLEGLPTLCANAAPDTVQTGPNTTAACCDELRELDDARCFCSEPFLGLDATRQGALVPALATARRRCGVDARVGRACLSVTGDDGADAEEDETDKIREPLTEVREQTPVALTGLRRRRKQVSSLPTSPVI